MSNKVHIDIERLQKIIALLKLSLTMDDLDITEAVIESVVESLQEEIETQGNNV